MYKIQSIIINCDKKKSISFSIKIKNLISSIIYDFSRGAATTCYLALHPDVKDVSCKYFENCYQIPTSTLDIRTWAKILWNTSQNVE
jgi:hypothetical protein